LPAWLDQGVVLGLKRGEDHARKKLDLARARGMRVVGLWCEDWAGVRETSFGTRLFWDWRWNKQRYPQLDRFIGDLHAEGLRFLGYVNPYLCNDGTLFAEAEANGVFARDADGTALVDFGEFVCGVVDFTKPDADAWFRNRILRENMLDLGLDGWMADFGEYLPVNVRLANGEPLLEHNRWPVRWAAANARAIADAGRTGDAVFFMRAGYAGVQAHCPLLWGGDQSVDFSRHDGLVTTIPAALSAGLLGNAYHHTDIGGYTSLFGNRRTPELFMRWAEAAAFTAVMRTHEGNRPTENFQWWESDAVMQHFARMTSLFAALAPYRRTLVAEAALNGLPLQRPPMLHFPHDPATFGLHDHFMLGPDLLIAPVHKASTDRWQAYLPVGTDWRHVWSGATFNGGTHADVPAAIGQPPVFIRTDAPSFDALTTLAGL
jgi:alpha-glucosidase